MDEDVTATLVAKATLRATALTVRPVTINQVVGYNMAWYRKVAGLTQEELGQRLGGWTKVAVSAAERSWDGKRIRQFDADELVAIAQALGVPVPALFLPPDDAGTAIVYALRGRSGIQLTELLPYFLPSPADQSPVMAAFKNRLMALDASYLTELDRAVPILPDGPMGADSLERDVLEQNRVAIESLKAQREELERRIDDLRKFERTYRYTILSFMDRQISSLRSHQEERKFVLKKGLSGKYHFNLVAANGQVVATSETYDSKQAALLGIEAVKSNALDAVIDEQINE